MTGPGSIREFICAGQWINGDYEVSFNDFNRAGYLVTGINSSGSNEEADHG